MAKIGIFGGSFNPPHLGHILAVEEFHSNLSLDKVVVVPASVPPHKRLTENSPAPEHRLEMTKLAMEGLDYAKVTDIELCRPGASYTADTIQELRKVYPQDEFYLLMGTDMFFSFAKWYHPERITKEAVLVVAHRSADDIERIQKYGEELKEQFSAQVVLLNNEYLDYSSTSARAMLAFDCEEDYLAPNVAEYIRKNGLYYCGKNLKGLSYEKLREISLSLHAPKRVAHVIGCSETAAELAKYHGANETDAKRAGILHDITKALNGVEQLKLCERYAMMISRLEQQTPKLLHAKTGAAVAQQVFGENENVFRAIYWHTTGRSNMSLLEKIIYLADYMEPNRDFDGVEELRRLAFEDLDKALCLGLQMTIDQLTSRGLEINEDSLSALRFLQERK